MSKAPVNNHKSALYKTVAVSDLFMATCALLSTQRIDKIYESLFESGSLNQHFTNHYRERNLGFLLFVCACSAGVLRFGFSPKYFTIANEIFALLAGLAGVPLIASFYYALIPEKHAVFSKDMERFLFNPRQFLTIIFPILTTIVWKGWKDKTIVQGLIKVAGVLSITIIGYCGYLHNNQHALLGVFLFAFGGLVITPNRHNCILNVRRENWFHYCLGLALILLSLGLCEIMMQVFTNNPSYNISVVDYVTGALSEILYL